MTRKWTYENCKKEALKYNHKNDFKNNSRSAYGASKTYGYFDEITSHMKRPKSTKQSSWDINKLIESTKPFINKSDWIQENPKAYHAAVRLKILKELYSKLPESFTKTIQYNLKWTYDKIKKSASNYDQKTKWQIGEPSAYDAARRKNIINDVCSHMKSTKNGKFIIYVFEFSDNSYYVGGTRRTPDDRYNEHITKEKSSVYIHIKKTGLIPTFKILWGETSYIHIAEKKEIYWDKYYQSKGWYRLNVATTGNLRGGPVYKKWTPEKIIKSTLKYNTVKDWRENEPGAFRISIKLGIYKDITNKLTRERKFNYSEQKLIDTIKKYNIINQNHLRKINGGMCKWYRRNKKDILNKHLPDNRRKTCSKEELIKFITKYQIKNKRQLRNTKEGNRMFDWLYRNNRELLNSVFS